MKKVKQSSSRFSFGFDDYLKANRKAAREIELNQNGGRWKAVNRTHKNMKKYDRKRDRRVDFDGFLFIFTTDFNIEIAC